MVFRASRQFLTYRTTTWAIGAGVLTLAAATPLALSLAMTFSNRSEEVALRTLGLVLLGAVVILMTSIWMMLRLDYAWRWYVVTDRSLRIREGVWQVREMTVTFANVQNLSVEQGPLQRLFGISDLRVDTAGGGGAGAGPAHGGRPGSARNLHTAWLRGLDNATEVRAAIQLRLRGRPDAGLGDLDDSETLTHFSPEALSPEVLWGAAEILAEARALRTVAAQLAIAGDARLSAPSIPPPPPSLT